jgi:anti-sigma factor RsiW
MNCRDVTPLAGNYLDGELPEEMGDRIQRHLIGCAGCREEVDSVRMAVEVLKASHPASGMSESAMRSALERMSRELDIVTSLPEAPGQLVLGIGIPSQKLE